MRARIVGLVLAVAGCVREEKLVDRFVEKYCEARWSCGCESPGLTQVHCESVMSNAGEEAQDAAQEAGLEYDRECAKAWLDAIDDSCAVPPVPRSQDNDCGRPCAPYHGNKAKGEPCEPIGEWSDCARGLRCGSYPKVCEDPCDGQRDGDHCDFDVGGQCGPGRVCSEGTCAPAPALGEACVYECQPGATCDLARMICVEAPGFGEPCSETRTCKRGLVCITTDDFMHVCDVGSAEVCTLGSPW